MKHVVYFFSGTGNSLAVAKQIEAIGAEVHSIAYLYEEMKQKGENEILCDASKIGFVFPTYYLGLPRIIHDFLKVLKITNAKYIYFVATMGWSIKGGIKKQIKNYLKQKNCKLNMGTYVQMPMNDFTLVNVDEPERQKYLLAKSVNKIAKVVKLIQNEKQHFDFEPIGFMVEKRNQPFCDESKNTDQKFIVNDICSGCGICMKMCSCKNIIMVNNKPSWQHDCQVCLSCFHNCPKKAIEFAGKGKEIPHYHHPDYSLKEKNKYDK